MQNGVKVNLNILTWDGRLVWATCHPHSYSQSQVPEGKQINVRNRKTEADTLLIVDMLNYCDSWVMFRQKQKYDLVLIANNK